MPESSSFQSPEPRALPLSDSDSRALARFLEQSLDHGFRLAIVEAASPADREAILADVAERVGPGLMRVDVDALPGADANLWQALREQIEGTQAPRCLVLWGIESREQPDWPRQLNVQRDLFVRDIGVPWLLFIHPATRVPLLQEAPDFCDFAILWLRDERPVQQNHSLTELVLKQGSFPIGSSPVLDGSSFVSPLLTQAQSALDALHFDEARDCLSSFDLQPNTAWGDGVFRKILGARLEREQGHLARAEALLRDSQNTLARQSPTHEVQALMRDTETELGVVMHLSGRPAEAEVLLRRSLAPTPWRTVCDDASDVQTRCLLACVLRSQGKFVEAEEMLRYTLKLVSNTQPENHPITAVLMQSLAAVLHGQGMYDEAEALLRQSMKVAKNALGGDHPLYDASLHTLGMVLQSQGKYAEAESLLRKSLALTKKSLGTEHFSYGESLQALAVVLLRQGQYHTAETLLRESLAIMKKALGVAHPSYSDSLDVLAAVLSQQGKYAEAEELLRESLSVTEKALGAEHPALCATLSKLAIVLARQQAPQEGVPLIDRAFQIAQTAWGDCNHPELGHILLTQSQFQAQLRDPRARQTAQRALAILTDKLGSSHPAAKAAAATVAKLKKQSIPPRLRLQPVGS